MGDRGNPNLNVRVVCRFRPQVESELASGGINVAFFDETGKNCSVSGQKQASFTFDKVFEGTSTQAEVYNYTAKPIVEDVLKGYNGTIFAYGQTSSGKTFTMEGPNMADEHMGITPRIIYNIFQYIQMAPETLEFSVRVSYFEIYMEKIKDLLVDGNDNLLIHENRERGVHVRHATELYVQDADDIMEILRVGKTRRSVASTNMNEASSRSHSVFQMEISQKDSKSGGSKAGKLYLVDLAGSEKVSKTGAEGEVLEEAKNINKSLSALGLVIMALTEGQSRQHVPYRDSKLTRILQDSLGGNCRTTIIICCSPSSYNEQETLSSLRFGQRAKKIKNCAVINVQYSVEELQRQLAAAKNEIRKLAKRLAGAEAELLVWRSGGNVREEDRVALTTPDDAPIATSLAVEERFTTFAPPSPSQAFQGLEREEYIKREAELLECLDDKDERIHQLEKELQQIMEEKLALTKFAAENEELLAKNNDLALTIEDLSGENEAYEGIISDMGTANSNLKLQISRIQEEKEELLAKCAQQNVKNQQQLSSIADALTTLATLPQAPKKGRQLPQAPGSQASVVDAPLSKLKAFIASLQNDLSVSKKEITSLQEARTLLESSLEDVRLEVSRLSAHRASLEEQTGDFKGRLESQDAELERQRTTIASLQDQCAQLSGDLSAAKATIDITKAEASGEISKGQSTISELKQTFEQKMEAHQLASNKTIAELRGSLDELKGAKNVIEGQRSTLQAELALASAQLEKTKIQNEKLMAQIHEQEILREKDHKSFAELQSVNDATRKPLETFAAYKAKLNAAILERQTRLTNEGNIPEEDISRKMVFLEKTNQELSQRNHELTRLNTTLKRDIQVLDKHFNSKSERIRKLELLIKDGEDRLLKQYERHILSLHAAKASRHPKFIMRKNSMHHLALVQNKENPSKVLTHVGPAFWSEEQNEDS